ncbi:TRAP transporter large permease [Sediminivirga luteola]|uniref:ABC transporter permease n=1 Tax=Sediminivirga luteola TaxID=1774748 RepID=A0A8J2XJJ5_9MICO|nr:TRAP transporter large permease [Sediminivirga luteola]GGA05677.1 ABC transporter permease [Sediminivirga luteola]
MIALIVTLVALALILARVPVGFALLIPSAGYILFYSSQSLTAAVERMTASLNSFPLLAVPLFILVGSLANAAGLSDRIFTAAQALVGRVRGGLGYVNILASLGFSWMSGSAASDVAVLGKITTPQMLSRGYPRRFVAGLTSASSLVAPMMPPSIPAIMFGVASGVSIGAMFLASVVPALLLTLVLILSVFLYTRRHPGLIESGQVSGSRRRAVLTALPVAFAPVIVLGGILGGIFTPTEAAATTVAYLLVLAFLVYRSLSLRKLIGALRETFSTSVTILFIVASSAMFGWVLTVERVPHALADLILSMTDSPTVFLLMMMVVLLLIGMVMEPTSAVLITTPVLFPISQQLNVDPVHFGVVLVFTLLIGLFTPPVGLVLFVLESVSTLRNSEIIRGVLPYVAVFIGFAILLILVPQIALWLPGIAQ